MTRLFILLVLVGAWSLLGQEIKMTDGEVISFKSIKRTEPDGLVILTESGVSKIRFAKMSEEDQKRYGYDPAKAESFLTGKKQEVADQTKEINSPPTAGKPNDIPKSSEERIREAFTINSNNPSKSDDLTYKRAEFNLSLVENEVISENLGIVGAKKWNRPPCVSGESMYVEVPFIQTAYAFKNRRAPDERKIATNAELEKEVVKRGLAGTIVSCFSMILNCYGENKTPREWCGLFSGTPYATNTINSQYDYWYANSVAALRKLNYQWTFTDTYRKNSYDFSQGVKLIKKSLDMGCPCVVNVNYGAGHDKWNGVVINGYDGTGVYIIDPNLAPPGIRIISYSNFEKIWRTLDGIDVRYLVTTSLKK